MIRNVPRGQVGGRAFAGGLIVGLLGSCQHLEPTPPATAPAHDAPACLPPTQPQFVALPAKAIAIAASVAHACALLETGRVWCWGDNRLDQLRSGARAWETPPHDIGLEHVTAISLGSSDDACVRFADGTPRCWGHRSGWNPDLPQSVLESPPPQVKADQVVAGYDHVCTLASGDVRCYGQFGNSLIPIHEISGATGATAIVGGRYGSCAIVGGLVGCWGAERDLSGCGRCDGSGCEHCDRELRGPRVDQVPDIDDATSLVAGAYDSCVLRKTGAVACWGAIAGPAGPGKPTVVRLPGVDDARGVTIGPHICVVRASGIVACWDYTPGVYGWQPDSPDEVLGITNATAVAAGDQFTCALLRDGRVDCWGVNAHGQLGFKTLTDSTHYVDVCGIEGAVQLAASGWRTCALGRDERIKCWGRGLGDGPPTAVPTALTLPSVAEIVGNDWIVDGICARTKTGYVKCWWQSDGWPHPPVPRVPVRQIALGKLGLCAVRLGGHVICNNEPVAGVVDASKVVVGNDFACALSTGHMTCWDASKAAPRTSQLEDVVDIVAAHDQLCAKTRDGAVRCAQGVFGIAKEQVPTDENLWSKQNVFFVKSQQHWMKADLDAVVNLPIDTIQVAQGMTQLTGLKNGHTCALRRNGRVACVGDNTFGQLGTGQLGLVLAPAR